MSNHMHLTPRNRPDIARCWSTREVAERWLRVVSTHEQDANNKESPSEEKINPITMDPERVEELRKRLSSISCFMGKLNEYIFRRANKEEGIGDHSREPAMERTRNRSGDVGGGHEVQFLFHPLPTEAVHQYEWQRGIRILHLWRI